MPTPEPAAQTMEAARPAANDARDRVLGLRGPWWWRLRCRLADRCGQIASALDPDDRSSMSWLSDDHQVMHIADVRVLRQATSSAGRAHERPNPVAITPGGCHARR